MHSAQLSSASCTRNPRILSYPVLQKAALEIAVISGLWFDLGIDVRAMIEQRLDNIVPTLCGS